MFFFIKERIINNSEEKSELNEYVHSLQMCVDVCLAKYKFLAFNLPTEHCLCMSDITFELMNKDNCLEYVRENGDYDVYEFHETGNLGNFLNGFGFEINKELKKKPKLGILNFYFLKKYHSKLLLDKPWCSLETLNLNHDLFIYFPKKVPFLSLSLEVIFGVWRSLCALGGILVN